MGAGNVDTGNGSQPDKVANFRGDMFLNDWTFSWLTRYIGAERVDAAVIMTHIRVAYDWNRYRFLFGINNVTDEDPPYAFNTGRNTDTRLYDVFGTYWYARVTFTM